MTQRIDTAGSRAPAVPGDLDSIDSSTAPSESASHFPELAFAVIVLTLITLRVIQQCEIFARLPGSDWNSSEWMINYAAGFVRRGLGGAFLEHLMRLTHWGFLPIWITLTTAAYIGVCAFLFTVSWRLGGSTLWRFALLLNPMLLVSASYYGSIGRKDILFIWATILIVLFCHHILKRERTGFASRAAPSLILLSVALLSSLLLALLHEGIFLFAWLPLNLALIAYTLSRLRWSATSVALLLSFAFGPALFAVVASAHRHGDVRTGQAICQSWHSFSIQTDCSAGENFPPAIDALSWSVSHGISFSRKYAWRFPAFLALFAMAGSVQIIALLVLIPASRWEHLLVLLAFPFLASLPLFLLGDDWGRWLCLVATCSLMAMLSGELRPALYHFLPATFRLAQMQKFAPTVEIALASLRRHAERRYWIFGVAILLLPMPFNPTKAAILATQPALIFKSLHHLWTR